MKSVSRCLLSMAILSLFVLSVPIFAQQLETIDSAIDNPAELEADVQTTSIFELVGQAGAIQYPIYGILIVGLLLISYRSVEIFSDNRASKEMHKYSFVDVSIDDIGQLIVNQKDYMLSSVMSKILNVFQTSRNSDYLHDEIANFRNQKWDEFKTFKNRIDFLSDTAGALGLLGTVWGMFIVFYSGTLEREIILVGMGVALMSTLLGLLVSIALNFFSTLTEGYYSKTLLKTISKADELRFRLIELVDYNKVDTDPELDRQENSGFDRKNENHNKKNKSHQHSGTSSIPNKIMQLNDVHEVVAGSKSNEIIVKLTDSEGNKFASETLKVSISDGDGSLNGKGHEIHVMTNSEGEASFNWSPGTSAGKKGIHVSWSDSANESIALEIHIMVLSDKPSELKIFNNNQAGVVGNKLSKPLRVILKDHFGNPVYGENVEFIVSLGNGHFKDLNQSFTTKTDRDGVIDVDFVLGNEPGFNAVEVIVPRTGIKNTFQAVGQEKADT